jgi:histidinol-phosphate aminotransferase
MTSKKRQSPIRDQIHERPPRSFPVFTAAAGGEGGVRVLAWNESPLPPSPRVLEAIAENAHLVNRYPDPGALRLADAISGRTGVPASRITLGSGSDELVALAAEITLEPGDEAVMPSPSFPGYPWATGRMSGVPVAVDLLPDGSNDVDGLLGAITGRTKLLYCSPVNNPSGGLMPEANLRRLIAGTPDNVLLAVDDAYFEFALREGAGDPLHFLAERSGPWVVLRTFSKAYSLAGLRVGYALSGSDEVGQSMLKAKPMFNVNALAQIAAFAALEDEAYRDGLIDACVAERARLNAGLEALDLVTMPSAGNFLSARLPIKGIEAAQGLADRGIRIKAWYESGYEDCIRITVGTSDDTDAVLAALADVLATAGRQRAAD